MATETERSREEGSEAGRESREERREGTSRSPDTNRPADAGTDPAAIEAARARAMATGVTPEEPSVVEEKTIFDFTKDAGSKAARVGTGSLKLLGGSLVVATYIGYKASRPVLFAAAHALDWIGHKMNSWADKLIDKKFPVLSWILNPFISFLDSSAKALGIDKTLAEHLKKNSVDRKKVAEKVFKDYMAAQKAAEKKADDSAAKAKRKKIIEEKLGPEVAAAIEGDVDAAAAAASAETTAPAPAAEAPKTT